MLRKKKNNIIKQSWHL